MRATCFENRRKFVEFTSYIQTLLAIIFGNARFTVIHNIHHIRRGGDMRAHVHGHIEAALREKADVSDERRSLVRVYIESRCGFKCHS